MRGSSLTFHGDEEDLSRLFACWFSDGELLVAETLSGLNMEPESGSTASFAMPRLLKRGALSSPAMVIGPSSQPVVYERVEMTDGSGVKSSIALNSRRVVGIRFGGHSGTKVLQPTVLTCSGDNPSATALFQRLRTSIIKQSRRVSNCWVLPGAYAKLAQGWRLPRGQFQAAFTDLPNPQ